MQSGPLSHTGQVFTLSMSGKESLPLRAGEIVTAEVLSMNKDNSATIRLKNTVLDVKTDVPLQTGDRLSLRVEKQENTIYLRLAGNAESADSVKSTILSMLNGFEKLNAGTEGMAKLVALLKMMPLPIAENLPEIDVVNRFLLQIGQVTGKTLTDLIENGGVFFESKLRMLALGLEAEGGSVDIGAGQIIASDLKASLLRLKSELLSPPVLAAMKDKISPDELIAALNSVLRNIEFYQLQSKLTDSLYFFLPLLWSQLKNGEVILRESDRGKAGLHSYMCTINLDLERAGKLRVNLQLQGGCIHVNCAAENENFFRVLQDGVGALKEQFNAAGLKLGNLNVHHQSSLDFSGSHAAGLSIRV